MFEIELNFGTWKNVDFCWRWRKQMIENAAKTFRANCREGIGYLEKTENGAETKLCFTILC
jgi:hypothetical protein